MDAPDIRKILCPTDFSRFSGRAFQHALALARRHGAGIDLIHVFPLVIPMIGDFPYATVIVPLDETTRERLSDDLEKLAAPSRKEGLAVNVSLVEGDPCQEILKRSRNSGCDIIVMGTHGLRGFERWLLGSVAERVLVKAPCSVMTVGRPVEGAPGPERPLPERILCALDLFGHAAATLQMALSLARHSKAGLSVVHVVEGLPSQAGWGDIVSGLPSEVDYRRQREARSRSRLDEVVPENAEGVGPIEKILVTGKAHEEILRVAAERRSDLIVIGAHERRTLGLPFIGSTVRHVVRGADCPVLTVRAAEGPPRA